MCLAIVDFAYIKKWTNRDNDAKLKTKSNFDCCYQKVPLPPMFNFVVALNAEMAEV